MARPPCWRACDQAQRILAGGECSPGDVELAVQFEQVEVAGRNVTYNRCHHGFAILFRRAQVSASGFGLISQTAPNVNLERQQI